MALIFYTLLTAPRTPLADCRVPGIFVVTFAAVASVALAVTLKTTGGQHLLKS